MHLPPGAYYLKTIEHLGIDATVPHPELGMMQGTLVLELRLHLDPRELSILSEAFYDDRVALVVEMPSRGRKAQS